MNTAWVRDFLLSLNLGLGLISENRGYKVGGSRFSIDLLFYDFRYSRYVAVAVLPTVYKLGCETVVFDCVAVDKQIKKPIDGPTVGILFCKTVNWRLMHEVLPGYVPRVAVVAYDELVEQWLRRS